MGQLAPFLFGLLLCFFRPFRKEVGQEQHDQDDYEDNRRKGKDRRPDADLHLAVDQGRDRIDARAAGKVGDDEVVKAHREGQQEAGKDARHDIREHDVRKGIDRRCAEILRGLEMDGAGLPQLRQNVQDYVGQAEGDMRKDHRAEA